MMEDSVRTLETSSGEILKALPEADHEIAMSVMVNMIVALRKRLSPDEGSSDTAAATLAPGPRLIDGLYALPEAGGYVITHLELLSETVHEEGTVSKPRDDASRVKQAIEKLLPLNNFIYRMDLKPGKFTDVNV
jgi:hypothetical protein